MDASCSRITSTTRSLLVVAAALLAGCATTSGANGPAPPCAPGTNIVLVQPRDGQTGVPASTGTITIAGDRNASTNLYMHPQSGVTSNTSPLTQVLTPNGPQYTATINPPGLTAGQVYLVYFNGTANCTPESPIGAFRT
jgi:type IV pilus biogenesis protein CpaD/CtpE